MSRNQREGRYCGALHGRHFRTHGVNNIVSSLDVCIELQMRQRRCTWGMFRRIAFDAGGALRILASVLSSPSMGDAASDRAVAEKAESHDTLKGEKDDSHS